MQLISRRLRAKVAAGVLVPFLWTCTNAAAWADTRAARRDPGHWLVRHLDATPMRASARRQVRAAIRDAHPVATPAPPAPPVLADRLHRVGDSLAAVADAAGARAASVKRTQRTAGRVRARSARAIPQLKGLNRQALRGFRATEAQLLAWGLGDEALARQRKSRERYVADMRAVLADLRKARRSHDPDESRQALASAATRLRLCGTGRPSRIVDPTKPAFRPATDITRPARATDAEYADGGTPRYTRAMAQLAAATPPVAAELAPNEDVQITPDITALAASLGNQPLAIYQWVRNNIEFLPTYGSVQGSQMTLDARRGNAFDIASLLIALLRAAGIGARYVMGSVELPTATVMNWVGGAATPQIALKILAQGGVATTAITSGANIIRIRVEHVWVEAWVDYVPSRGAVHKVGDTWIPMDASLKLHSFTPPSNILTDVPFDASALASNPAMFTVDPALGKFTNFNFDTAGDALGTWTEQASAYLNTNAIPKTLDGIAGGQAVIPRTVDFFEGSLPYVKITARSGPTATLPQSVRHYATLDGFETAFDHELGNTAFSYRVSLPALNSRRFNVEFDPATAGDAATLAAARANNASALPVNIVNVTPVVKLDGVPVLTGGAVGMGTDYFLDLTLESLVENNTLDYKVIAGDEIAFGITGNGLNAGVLQKRLQNFPVDTPGPEYFNQVQLHYWAEDDYLADVVARGLGVHAFRLPSAGLYGSPLEVTYLFDQPETGVYQSRFMDVKRNTHGAAAADPTTVVAFQKQVGYQGSYLEGSTFNQLDRTDPPSNVSISSMHVITAAAGTGVPIFRITPANAAAAVPQLSLPGDVMSGINAALAAGQTVITPQHNVVIGRWTGVGYILQDETTGAGSYLINGGINGGGKTDCPHLSPEVEKVLDIVMAAILAIVIVLVLALLLGWLAPLILPIAAEAMAGLAALSESLGALILALA